MSDNENNNPALQTWIEPELEARIVAWVVGEASAFETAELTRIVAEKPELEIFTRRITAVHGLVATASRPGAESMRLSPERRNKLLEKLGKKESVGTAVPTAIPMQRRRSSWRPSIRFVIGLAACLVICLFLASLVFMTSGYVQRSAARDRKFAVQYSEEAQRAVSGDAAAEPKSPLALNKTGAGHLFGSNSYTGGTAINGGTLGIEAENAPLDVPIPAAATPKASAAAGERAKSKSDLLEGGKDELASLSDRGEALRRETAQVDMASAMPGRPPELPSSQAADDFKSSQSSLGKKLAQTQSEGFGLDATSSISDTSGGVIDASRRLADGTVANMQWAGGFGGAGGGAVSGMAGQTQDYYKNQDAPVAEPKPAAPSQPIATLRTDEAVQIATAEKSKSSGEKSELANQFYENGNITNSRMTGTGAGRETAAEGKEFQGNINYGAQIHDINGGASVSLGDIPVTGQVFKNGSTELATAAAPITASGASGNLAIAGNAIDALLFDGPKGQAEASESDGVMASQAANVSPTALIDSKLSRIIIPKVDFKDATVREAIGFLRNRAADLDADPAPDRPKGINIVLQPNDRSREGDKQRDVPAATDKRVTLKLSNASLSEVLGQIASLSGLGVRVDPYAIVLAPAGAAERPAAVNTSEAPAIERKLERIIIPRIDFRDATVQEVADFLTKKGRDLDPDSKGVNIVPPNNPTEKRITFQLNNLPLLEVLRYVASSSGLAVNIGPDGVSLVPDTERQASAKKQIVEEIVGSETKAADQPFSTFSLHVSDVSFRLAQTALAKGEMPDAESIRPEEFYNAFDYGDPSPGAGEKVGCRIEQSAHPFLQQRNLVRIAMKVPATGRGKSQPLRLTVLLDTSGSMEREDRAASVRRAVGVLATLLGPEDRITLIGFSRQPRLLADQVRGDQAGKLVETIANTPSEGGTNLEEAIKLGSELARRHRVASAQNRIVLLTDGAANLGNADAAQLGAMIEKLRQRGIAFDACGVGADGLNDEILESLTRKGDGRYYLLNRPEDADVGFARQLAGAFRPAAQNVKLQVRFNPARVGSYRLIGFEKHLLKKEDFRNDKVDAAELAAEEAAVALYQVEVLPEGEGEIGEVFVRFRDPADGRAVEQSWTVTYDPQARPFDQATPTMQLAGTAALLAEKLRGGAAADLIELDKLSPIVNRVRGQFPESQRVQQLAQIFEQMRRMEGKK